MNSARLTTLDAMRGLAAIAVVIFHSPVAFFASGYLAVDFFFMLSGVVITRAYDDRLTNDMSTCAFIAERLVRLYPLYLIGLLIGVSRAIGHMQLKHPDQMNVVDLTSAAASALLFLPSLVTIDISPLNVPGWSLIFEIGINIVYAFCLVGLRSGILMIVTFLCLAGLLVASQTGGSLLAGSQWGELHVGAARVGFGFVMGMILCRLNKASARRSRVALIAPCVLLLALAASPGEEFRGLFDMVFVALLAPLIILLGMKFNMPAELSRLASSIGNVSYCIYVIHFPLLSMTGYLAKRHGVPVEIWMPIFLPGLLLTSYLLNHSYDRPFRALLTKWWKSGLRRKSVLPVAAGPAN